MPQSGLYIHIPFCIQRCSYCDFFSCVTARKNSNFVPYKKNPAFIDRIINDITALKNQFTDFHFRTVYVGGGTPSLLGTEDIITLGKTIAKQQHEPIGEFTIEANPEDITPALLDAWHDAGITRVSVGVQSFDNTVLQHAHRRGSKTKTTAALDLLFRRPFDISIDLIAGLKGQTAHTVMDDICTALSYRPQHVSLYELSDGLNVNTQEYEERALLFETGTAALQESGYNRYEVSNFAYAKKFESKHNKIYWHLQTYLGVGPGAVGTIIAPNFMSAVRLSATTNLDIWNNTYNRKEVFEYEYLDKNTLIKETLMMGFRLFEGINRKKFTKQFLCDVMDIAGTTITRWESAQRCIVTKQSIRLNEQGMKFLNLFLLEIFAELR